jgi:hypothetical protein
MGTFEDCIKKLVDFLCSQEKIVMQEVKKEKIKKKSKDVDVTESNLNRIIFIYNDITKLLVERDGRSEVRDNVYRYYDGSKVVSKVKTESFGYTPDLYSDEFLNDLLKPENLGNYEGFYADDSVAQFIFEHYTIEINIKQSMIYFPKKNPVKRNIRELVLCFNSTSKPASEESWMTAERPEPSAPELPWYHPYFAGENPMPSAPEIPSWLEEQLIPVEDSKALSIATPIASYNGERDHVDYYLESGIPVTTVSGLISVPDENVEQNPLSRILRKELSRITGVRGLFKKPLGRGGTRKRKMTKRKNIKTKHKKK